MAAHVLPVLQNLEVLYRRDKLGATPRLVGKSLEQVEADGGSVPKDLRRLIKSADLFDHHMMAYLTKR